MFKTECSDISKYHFYKVYDGDIGQIDIIDNQCLMIQSSNKIQLFLEKEDPMTEEVKWKLIHTIKIRGSIYYIKDTDRFQVTTEDYVYFYLVDLETFEPTLENVMNNFMGCSQMMVGKMVRNAIAFKMNQKSFSVFQKKFHHCLRAIVNDGNFAGSLAIEFITIHAIVLTAVDKLLIFDD